MAAGLLTTAAEISRLVVGDAAAMPREAATYQVSYWTLPREHVEGAPHGTRDALTSQVECAPVHFLRSFNRRQGCHV